MTDEINAAAALEILRCAQCNFDNLVAMNPIITKHPIYLIARSQLDNGIKTLEGKDIEEAEDDGEG